METERQERSFDASTFTVSIVISSFHRELSEELLANTIEELKRNQVREENIKIFRVAGALEIPYICRRIVNARKTDIIITLGVVIRGETSHYDLVTQSTYKGIMEVQLEAAQCPISFGLLACENIAQAKRRVSKEGLNKGKYAAQAALLQEYIIKTQI